MTTYIILFCYISLMGFFIHKIRNSQNKNFGKILLFIIIGILVVVTGIRGVGADFGNYIRMYENQKNFSFADLWQSIISFNEPGYRLICMVSKWIYDSPITMFTICAILTIVPIIIVTYKESDNFALAIVLYILLVWDSSFGAIRQAIASAFIVLGLPYIKQKKFFKYCLCVIVASTFHFTALIMLPVYFVIAKRTSFINTLIVIVVSLILLYSYDFIFEVLNIYKDKDITEYSYMTTQVNIFRILVAFAPILLFVFVPKDKSTTTTLEGNSVSLIDISMNIVLVNAALMFAMMNSAYFARAGIYTIAFFPIAISEIIKKYDKKTYAVIVVVMVMMYFIYWLYGIHAQGLEYITFFQR